MGTNFYLADTGEHVGKRSAAGPYCWDCGVTLIAQGERRIHSEHATILDACPRCGAKEQEKGYNAALVELGFAKPNEEPLKGVHTASSFTWAQKPETIIALCMASEKLELVQSEYGDTYSGPEFLRMLDMSCPIRFYESIGRDFC